MITFLCLNIMHYTLKWWRRKKNVRSSMKSRTWINILSLLFSTNKIFPTSAAGVRLCFSFSEWAQETWAPEIPAHVICASVRIQHIRDHIFPNIRQHHYDILHPVLHTSDKVIWKSSFPLFIWCCQQLLPSHLNNDFVVINFCLLNILL
jgi:hypothetical protein